MRLQYTAIIAWCRKFCSFISNVNVKVHFFSMRKNLVTKLRRLRHDGSLQLSTELSGFQDGDFSDGWLTSDHISTNRLLQCNVKLLSYCVACLSFAYHRDRQITRLYDKTEMKRQSRSFHWKVTSCLISLGEQFVDEIRRVSRQAGTSYYRFEWLQIP